MNEWIDNIKKVKVSNTHTHTHAYTEFLFPIFNHDDDEICEYFHVFLACRRCYTKGLASHSMMMIITKKIFIFFFLSQTTKKNIFFVVKKIEGMNR